MTTAAAVLVEVSTALRLVTVTILTWYFTAGSRFVTWACRVVTDITETTGPTGVGRWAAPAPSNEFTTATGVP